MTRLLTRSGDSSSKIKTTPSRRRWLPRFSLMSLLILLCLVGCGFGLWVRWEPWVVDRKVKLPGQHIIGLNSKDNELVTVSSKFRPTRVGLVAMYKWHHLKHRHPVAYEKYFAPKGGGLVIHARFTGKSNLIALMELAGTVQLYDRLTGHFGRHLVGPGKMLTSSVLSADGRFLLTCGLKEARLWNLEIGTCLRIFKHDEVLTNVAISPDNKFVALSSRAGSLALCSVDTGKIKKTFKHEGDVYAVNFSPDGKWLVSHGSDKTVRIWNVESDKPVETFDLKECKTNLIHSYFSGDDMLFVTGRDVRPFLFVRNSKKQWRRVDDALGPMGTRILEPVPGTRKVMLTGADEKSFVMCDLEQKRKERTFSGHKFKIESASISKDQSRVVSCCEGDPNVKVWDVESGVCLVTLSVSSQAIKLVYFLEDANRILLINSNWEATYLKRLRPEFWWGIAWLWEFWITAFLGCALIWNLRRDRNYFDKTTEIVVANSIGLPEA